MVLRVLAFIGVRTLVNSFRRVFQPCAGGADHVGDPVYPVWLGRGAVRERAGQSFSQCAHASRRSADSAGACACQHADSPLVLCGPLWLSALFRPVTLLFQESDVHYLFTTPLRALSVFRGLLLMRGLLGAVMLFLMMVAYVLLMGGRTTMRAFGLWSR